jgi:intracellular sulfur oxidation DsrE/DsrF family protein
VNHPPSDECLNALIDGELAPADAAPVLEQLRGDAALRERLSQLQLGKVLVRHAFEDVQPPQRAHALHGPQRWRALAAGFAGSAVLASSALLGWVAHDRAQAWSDAPGLAFRTALEQAAAAQPQADQRVVVHLSEAPQALAALVRAQGLLEAARASGRTVTVEIVANGGGLDLLREGVSERAARIAALRSEYPGLSLVACGRTVQKLREAGTDVRLLPGTLTASSALDEIILRMQQGWAYVRV